jgi:GT2 family glycosyltransferase
MKIGFAFTNYNNSLLSIQAAKSISENKGDFDCRIILVDNSSKEDEKNILMESGALPSICSVLWSPINVGYFAGLNLGIDELLRHDVGL